MLEMKNRSFFTSFADGDVITGDDLNAMKSCQKTFGCGKILPNLMKPLFNQFNLHGTH